MKRPAFPIRVRSIRLFSIAQKFEPDFYHIPESMVRESRNIRGRQSIFCSSREYEELGKPFRIFGRLRSMSGNTHKLMYYCSNVGMIE